jgi:hypothetical protein
MDDRQIANSNRWGMWRRSEWELCVDIADLDSRRRSVQCRFVLAPLVAYTVVCCQDDNSGLPDAVGDTDARDSYVSCWTTEETESLIELGGDVICR